MDHCENTMIFLSVTELFYSVPAPFEERKIIPSYFGLKFFKTSITKHKTSWNYGKFHSS